MIQLLKAADRVSQHLGGAHVCTTFIPSTDPGAPQPVLAGITDALLMPGESYQEPAPPTTAHTVVTFMLEGIAERSESWRDTARLSAGCSQIEPLPGQDTGGGSATKWHNPSRDEISRLLRFWITRCRFATRPKIEAKSAPLDTEAGQPQLLTCPKGSAHHLRGPEGMALWHVSLGHGQRWRRPLGMGHQAWVNVTSGEAWCCGKILAAGDAALTHNEPCLRLQAKRPAQLFVLEFEV